MYIIKIVEKLRRQLFKNFEVEILFKVTGTRIFNTTKCIV